MTDLHARFEIVEGPDRGVVLAFSSGFIIGRAADAQFRTPNDHAVGHRHAFVNNDGSSLQISDLGSATGTWINSHRIDRPTYLRTGDVLRVGVTQIAVTIGTIAGREPSSAIDGLAALWSQPAVEHWLGDRKIVREIGRGTTGIVYEIELPDGRRRAAKLIQQTLQDRQDVSDQFRREIALHRDMQHENIVCADEVVELSGGVVCLVMDYIDGGNAEDLLQRAPSGVDPQRAVSICLDVLAALAYAHARKVVHRDVKTTNVLIAHRTGRALLADFGVAKAYEAATSSIRTATGARGGTAMFAAPEQLKDLRSARPTADIYGVGALAYRLLTAAFPFDLDGRDPLAAVMLNPRVPVRARRSAIPEKLAAIIETALARDPSERFASAEAMAAAMRPFS